MTTEELMISLTEANESLTASLINSIIDKGYDANFILSQKEYHLIIGLLLEFLDTLPYGVHCSSYGYGVTVKDNNVLYVKTLDELGTNLITDVVTDKIEPVLVNLLRGIIFVFKYIKNNEF